jgi:hypothetical protein
MTASDHRSSQKTLASRGPSTHEAALRLFLGPALLAAVAFEHASRTAILRIEHFPKELGFFAAMTACWDWVWLKAGKDFVFKFVIHNGLAVERGLISYEVNICSKVSSQSRISAWNDLLTRKKPTVIFKLGH